MRFGVVVFPRHMERHRLPPCLGPCTGPSHVEYVWHKDSSDLRDRFDCLIIPGGFSYGDYLRAGALAQLSPVMKPIREYAASGLPVMGICNGFQILCEAGLLPGILMRNQHLGYRCQWTNLRVESTSPFTGDLQRRADTAYPRLARRRQLFRERSHPERDRRKRTSRLSLLHRRRGDYC